MKQIYLIIIFSLLILAASPGIAQEKQQVIEKKVIVIEKDSDQNEERTISIDARGSEAQEREISVDIDSEIKNGKEVRTIKLTIREDGETELIEWQDDGEIPAEIKEKLEAEDIDLQILQPKEQGEMTVNVTVDADDDTTERNIKIMTVKDGEEQEIEWEDQGEIPAEVKKMLSEKGIDLQILQSGSDQEKTVSVTVEGDNDSTERSIKIITKKDGEEPLEMNWQDNGQIPADIQELLEKEGVDIKIMTESDDKSSSQQNVNVNVSKKEIDGIIERTIEIDIDENGERQKLKWRDDGTVPEDIQKKLDELGIDINDHLGHHEHDGGSEHIFMVESGDLLLEENENGNQQIRVSMVDGNGIPDGVKALLDEAGVNIEELGGGTQEVNHVMIVKQNGDSDAKTIQWNGDGVMPEDMQVIIEESTALLKGESTPNKTQLGIMIEELDSGIKVSDVIKDSAAEEVGILPGDIITHADGIQMHSIESLLSTIATKEVHDQVELSLNRDEKVMNVIATLKAGTDGTRSIKKIIIQEAKCNTKDMTGDYSIDQLFQPLDQETLPQIEGIVIINDEDSAEIEVTQTEQKPVKLQAAPTIPKHKRLSLKEFNAFPNPASDHITVSFEGERAPTVIQLIDITGQSVFKETLNDFSGQFQRDIDLSAYRKGQFILYIIQKQRVFTHSILLQ